MPAARLRRTELLLQEIHEIEHLALFLDRQLASSLLNLFERAHFLILDVIFGAGVSPDIIHFPRRRVAFSRASIRVGTRISTPGWRLLCFQHEERRA